MTPGSYPRPWEAGELFPAAIPRQTGVRGGAAPIGARSARSIQPEARHEPIPLCTRSLLALTLAALIALPQAGLAQAPAKPAPGKPTAVSISDQKVELLFVQNSTGIEYNKAKGTLRMKNIGRSTLFFTDRPVRMAGHYHTRDEFLKLWSEGPDSFAKNPPNATLSMLEVGQADLQNAVINLKNPRMQGKDLIYDITIIEGTVPQAAGDAVLFIDILGFWRRNIRRVAVIGTAAAVTTAAVATSSAEASAAASRRPRPRPPRRSPRRRR